MYPYTNTTGQMKVSQAMTLMNFIAVDWNQKMRCDPASQKMLCFGNSFKVVSRILKHSARNN